MQTPDTGVTWPTLAEKAVTVVAAGIPLAAPSLPPASEMANGARKRPDLDIDPGCARARPYAAAASSAATATDSNLASAHASQPHVAAAAYAAMDQPTCARALPYSAMRLISPSSRGAHMPAAGGGIKLPAFHASTSDPTQLANARGPHSLPSAATDGSPALFSPGQTGPGPSDQGFTAQTRADQQRSGLLQVSQQATCTNQQAVQQGDVGCIHGAAAAVISSSAVSGRKAARELVAEDDGPSQEAIQVRQLHCGELEKKLPAASSLHVTLEKGSLGSASVGDCNELLNSSAGAGAQAAATSMANARAAAALRPAGTIARHYWCAD